MSDERRSFRRKVVNARVLLIHPDIGELESYTHDISNSGVFVLIQPLPNLPVGTELDMRMLNSSNSKLVFKMELARSDKLGLGLHFLGYEKNGVFQPMSELQKEWKK